MRYFEQILKDEAVKNEVIARLEENKTLPKAPQWSVSNEMMSKAIINADEVSSDDKTLRPVSEAVVHQFMRPVLLVRNGTFAMPDSNELKARLLASKKLLEKQIPSVGRIEFRHHSKPWGGTGWMIGERTIATNRHVARHFAEKVGKSITFLKNFMGETIEARIDFREEYNAPSGTAFEVAVEKVLFMEDNKNNLPDVAFLRLAKSDSLPAPIPVSNDKIKISGDIAIIGYPARDPTGAINNDVAFKIFGDIYDVKRLAPGKILNSDDSAWYFTHDASTLGGNSGSVVLDLESGMAIGLHFSGLVSEANFAVKGTTVMNYLSKQSLKVTVPALPPKLPDVTAAFQENTPKSYADRKGYKPEFIGKKHKVALPVMTGKNAKDVLTFTDNGKKTSELKYTHFSVVMSKSRRLCFFSACNINGELSVPHTKRVAWQIDGRIPKTQQIKEECYGNPPQFSRGHMTRREDPAWGDKALAQLGSNDSMHVTNAVPQMQRFNAPVWLELEDYALQNCRADDMNISVFTGPYYSDSDPVMYGVKIPTEFWKVIAFIHDKTKKLTATGYKMSQASYLSPEEFIFGAFDTYQTPIKAIENVAGISFGTLSKYDPYGKVPEGPISPLNDIEQVLFI